MHIMRRYSFRKLRKLWIIYIFLLFFSFFMFLICINVYLQNVQEWETKKKNWAAHKELRHKSSKNVIVAEYVGTGNIFGNLTKEDTDIVNFHPIEKEGMLGRPVLTPMRDSFKMERLFKINSFNLLASDRMPLNRTLKDYRSKSCQLMDYGQSLPNTSIIIVFHNEAWSVLLRTIWSVISRSPTYLLHEILLIDDASDRVYLKKRLDDYIKDLPIPTKIFHFAERQGLVPARLKGAHEATGEILTFLDAHCECSDGWLEPLLARIQENRKTVICPVIDIISDKNFGYIKTIDTHWGAFNWNLQFRWYMMGRNDNQPNNNVAEMHKPKTTPAMAGGLYSIDRKYFFEMGGYDPEMKIWGGENVEMSFRIWQCGGQIEIHPCSHVGHIFRTTTPYTFPGGINKILESNLLRAALVWMDEWSDFYLLYNVKNVNLKYQLNITDRLQLRQKLQCKSFDWYLKNIWPNNYFPSNENFFGKIVWLNQQTLFSSIYNQLINDIPTKLIPKKISDIFQIIWRHSLVLLNTLNLRNDTCLTVYPHTSNHDTNSKSMNSVYLNDCTTYVNLQDLFVITVDGKIMTNENLCLDLIQHTTSNNKNNINLRFFNCYENEPRQKWNYDIETQQISSELNRKLCLTVDKNLLNGKLIIAALECKTNDDDYHQKWGLVALPWKFSII